MTTPLIVRLTASAALAVFLSGCALRSPSVADIQRNPGRFHDRTVAINGVVTSSWGMSGLVPFKLYKVDDGTGEMTVIATSGRGPVPAKGDRVRVKGRINQVASFGGQSVGLHLQQRDLDFRR